MTKETKEAAAPAGESKADKFKRLAVNRTEKALNAIAIIGGLAAKTNYDYTPEQVEKIITALNEEVAKLEARFAKPTTSDGPGFSL